MISMSLEQIAAAVSGEIYKGKPETLVSGACDTDSRKIEPGGIFFAKLGESEDGHKYLVDAALSGNGFTIVATRTDDFDAARAKSNVEDTLVKYPELAGVAGLFAYNAPACVEALKGAGRLGTVAIASFDEQDATLDGIAAGHVLGTVSQNPFQYGYESVRILKALCEGDESVLPEGGILSTPPTVVKKDNLEAFRAKLKADIASGSGK